MSRIHAGNYPKVFLSVLKNRHSGQRPPFIAKAVWHRGRYWEWTNNSYADGTRVQIPRGVAAAFDDSGAEGARLPYAGHE